MTENIEMAVFAIALLLMTFNIIVCTWFVDHRRHVAVGAWITRLTAILPGFIAVCAGIYFQVHASGPGIGQALSAAGLLLIFGAIQLLSMVVRLDEAAGGKSEHG